MRIPSIQHHYYLMHPFTNMVCHLGCRMLSNYVAVNRCMERNRSDRHGYMQTCSKYMELSRRSSQQQYVLGATVKSALVLKFVVPPDTRTHGTASHNTTHKCLIIISIHARQYRGKRIAIRRYHTT